MVQTKREYQKVIEYLRKMITDGKLKIGSKLPTERELSEKLSVSRNSTREALRTLENMGVTESRRGSGNYIVGNTEKSVSGIIDMMLILKKTNQNEICSFRRNLDKAICMSLLDEGIDMQSIKTIETACKEEKYAENTCEQIENDRLFHYSLLKATGNQLWISIAEAIMSVYRRWIDAVLQNSSEQTIAAFSETHEKILESIKNNDRSQCEKWIDKHYDLVDEEMKRSNNY